MIESPQCAFFQNEIESLEHLFYKCENRDYFMGRGRARDFRTSRVNMYQKSNELGRRAGEISETNNECENSVQAHRP